MKTKHRVDLRIRGIAAEMQNLVTRTQAAMRCRANLRSAEGATNASNYIANAAYWARIAYRHAVLAEVNS